MAATPSAETADELRDELQRMVRAQTGTAAAHVEGVRPTQGHAGLTYFFRVRDAGGEDDGEFVLRLPPAGVRRHGNTDVYRQVPLLRALKQARLPVPEVRWADPGERWFGRPFMTMRRVPGRILFLFDPDESFERSRAAIEPLWRQATEWLAELHAFDWKRELPDWQAPAPLENEVRRWRRIYEQSPEPAWARAAQALEARLLETMPDGAPVGLVHGDYQPGNILYEDGRAMAVLDWELSGIGAQGLDLGWMMMGADPQMWAEAERPHWALPPEQIWSLYQQRRGLEIPDAHWYEALAGFRLGSITCLNVKLHRRGQRHDPIWERFANTVQTMFERSLELVGRKG